MSKWSVKKILNKLPDDFLEHSVRDVTLLTSAIFGQTHFTTLPKYFDVHFTAIFMKVQKGQVGIYRSPGEYEKFSKTIADRIVEEPGQAKKYADELIRITDWIYSYIKKNEQFQSFMNNSDEFLDVFRDFFAYHQVVYFGGEYLVDNYIKDNYPAELHDAVQLLDKAYTYNEMVAPDLEKYFAELGVDYLLPSEVRGLGAGDKQERVKDRSPLYLEGEEIVLAANEADELARAIGDRQSKRYEGKMEAKGMGICGGVYKGRAKVITQFDELDEIQPGEVLVTPITRPQFNDQIKEAGAIVSDLGGLLSHPSILAREYGIPCVVGTEIATKIIETGDEVEVDADKGVVKVIKMEGK